MKAFVPTLTPENLVILVGAGASISSGIATAQMFNKSVMSILLPKDLETSKQTDPLFDPRNHIRFEQLVQLIRDVTDRELLILQYMEQSWKPSLLHFWLADMASLGATILTTNFESLIEVAFYKQFGRLMQQVVTMEEYAQLRDANSNAPKCFKLHGSLRRSDYLVKRLSLQDSDEFTDINERTIDTISATLDRVGYLDSQENLVGQFILPREILETLKVLLAGRDLLVLGYSGSDDFDIKPSLKLLRSIYNRIIWVAHEDRPALVMRSMRRFTLVKGNTSDILQRIHTTDLEKGEVAQISASENLASFVEKWARLIRLSETNRYLITGEILRRIGYLSNGISVWEYGLENARASDVRATSKLYLCLGDAYFAEGSYLHAEETFELAIRRTVEIEDWAGCCAAHIGLAGANWFMGSILQEERFSINGLTFLQRAYEFLNSARNAFHFDYDRDRIVDCEIRAAIMMSQIARWSGEIQHAKHLILKCSGRNSELVEVLEAFAGSRVFERDKVRYVDFLRELSLLYFYLERGSEFERARREHHRICDLLGLGLAKALYTLDLAGLASFKDFERAEELYHRSSLLFQRIRCDVGRAESCEGEALMMILRADLSGAETLLKNALRTYRNYRLELKVAIVWIELGGACLLDGKDQEAAAYFKKARERSHSEQLNGLGSILEQLMSCAEYDQIRITQLLFRCWREGSRRAARENIAMSGWLTAKDFDGANVFDDLFL